jgi:hypothetical protein
MLTAYRERDGARGRELMQRLIESLSDAVPAALTEVIALGRMLKKRGVDVLAYIDQPGTSNGYSYVKRPRPCESRFRSDRWCWPLRLRRR